MYAYGKEFDAPLVVLIYPRHGTLNDTIDEYSHHKFVDNKERQIIVRTVDVSQPMNQLESVRNLRSDLLSCLGAGAGNTQ
jgi:hypothetical protein